MTEFRERGVIPYRDASWHALNAAAAAVAAVFPCARTLAVNDEVTFINIDGGATAVVAVFTTAFAEAVSTKLNLHRLASPYTGGAFPVVNVEDFKLWADVDDRYVGVRRALAEPELTKMIVDFTPAQYSEADITTYMNGVDREVAVDERRRVS